MDNEMKNEIDNEMKNEIDNDKNETTNSMKAQDENDFTTKLKSTSVVILNLEIHYDYYYH